MENYFYSWHAFWFVPSRNNGRKIINFAMGIRSTAIEKFIIFLYFIGAKRNNYYSTFQVLELQI